MGKHLNPRRKLTAPPEEFKRWDRAASKVGWSWAVWARAVLNGELYIDDIEPKLQKKANDAKR